MYCRFSRRPFCGLFNPPLVPTIPDHQRNGERQCGQKKKKEWHLISSRHENSNADSHCSSSLTPRTLTRYAPWHFCISCRCHTGLDRCAQPYRLSCAAKARFDSPPPCRLAAAAPSLCAGTPSPIRRSLSKVCVIGLRSPAEHRPRKAVVPRWLPVEPAEQAGAAAARPHPSVPRPAQESASGTGTAPCVFLKLQHHRFEHVERFALYSTSGSLCAYPRRLMPSFQMIIESR